MILITGADGYIGTRLLEQYLKNTEEQIVAWVRARTEGELSAKKDRLQSILHPHKDRVSIGGGQLTDEKPYASIVQARKITKIIHTAAVIRFNVDEDTARRVNQEGAQKTFEFAQDQCPKLERLVHISSLYASGLEAGLMEEGPFSAKAGFANHYERSKWEAEELLQKKFSQLPWQIHRIATLLCDDESGRVTQYNAVHNTLKLFYYGLISLIPGDQNTPVHLVSGDFVAKGAFAAVEKGANQTFYNICHQASECLKLSELIDLVFEVFAEVSEDFKSRRLLKPLFVDQKAFQTMSKAVQGFGSDITQQALASMTPFAEELFVKKDVVNSNLRKVLGADYPVLGPKVLMRRVCEYLAKSKFGREPNV